MSAYAYGRTIARAGPHAPLAGSRGGRHTRDGWSSLNVGRVAIGSRISGHGIHCCAERSAGRSSRLHDSTSTRIAVVSDRCRESFSTWKEVPIRKRQLRTFSNVLDDLSVVSHVSIKPDYIIIFINIFTA